MKKKQYITIGILALSLAILCAVAYGARIGAFRPKDTIATGTEAWCIPAYSPTDAPGIRHSLLETEQNTLRVTLHLPETDTAALNEQIRQAAQARADAFLAQNSEGFFEARYQTHRYNTYLVSFALDFYAYTPDTGLSHTRKTMLVDLMGGREVHLSDMFIPEFDYITASAEIVRARFIEDAETLAADAEAYAQFLAAAETLSAPLAENYDCYILDANRLIFFFPSIDGTPLSVAVPLADYGGNWLADAYAMQYFGTREGDNLAANDSPLPEITPEPTAPPEPSNAKYLALTFDDGPTRSHTERLLDGLAEMNAHATFFVVGHRLGTTGDLIQRMVDEGHSVGSHSYNHADLTAITREAVAYQLDTTNDLIREITGLETTLLRPPYGARDARLAEMATARGMSLIIWSVDPQDWKTREAKALSAHIISHAKDGDIILLHDLYGTSVDAALIAVRELTAQGYIFVTVDELLEINGGRTVGGIYRTGKATVTK